MARTSAPPVPILLDGNPDIPPLVPTDAGRCPATVGNSHDATQRHRAFLQNLQRRKTLEREAREARENKQEKLLEQNFHVLFSGANAARGSRGDAKAMACTPHHVHHRPPRGGRAQAKCKGRPRASWERPDRLPLLPRIGGATPPTTLRVGAPLRRLMPAPPAEQGAPPAVAPPGACCGPCRSPCPPPGGRTRRRWSTAAPLRLAAVEGLLVPTTPLLPPPVRAPPPSRGVTPDLLGGTPPHQRKGRRWSPPSRAGSPDASLFVDADAPPADEGEADGGGGDEDGGACSLSPLERLRVLGTARSPPCHVGSPPWRPAAEAESPAVEPAAISPLAHAAALGDSRRKGEQYELYAAEAP